LKSTIRKSSYCFQHTKFLQIAAASEHLEDGQLYRRTETKHREVYEKQSMISEDQKLSKRKAEFKTKVKRNNVHT
jgi:hypothetical protein